MSVEASDKELLTAQGVGLLDRIVAISLRNRLLAVIGLLLLVALGIRSMLRLPIASDGRAGREGTGFSLVMSTGFSDEH